MAGAPASPLPLERKIQEVVYHQMIESGEKDRLQELFKERLIESGWYDELKAKCREIIAQLGSDICSTEQLFIPLAEFGRQQVPEPLRQEFLAHIRKFLATCTLTTVPTNPSTPTN